MWATRTGEAERTRGSASRDNAREALCWEDETRGRAAGTSGKRSEKQGQACALNGGLPRRALEVNGESLGKCALAERQAVCPRGCTCALNSVAVELCDRVARAARGLGHRTGTGCRGYGTVDRAVKERRRSTEVASRNVLVV